MRALLHEIHADSFVDATNGHVTLKFRNTGKKGVVFHVYDRLHSIAFLDAIPSRPENRWMTIRGMRATREPANMTSRSLRPERLRAHVHGMDDGDRFGSALPEVTLSYDVSRREIVFKARNNGKRDGSWPFPRMPT